MKLNVTIELLQRGRWIIAKIPELDFVAQGKTIEEAKKNLGEVVNIQFSEMKESGVFEEYLAERGFLIREGTIEPDHEVVGFEKHTLQVA